MKPSGSSCRDRGSQLTCGVLLSCSNLVVCNYMNVLSYQRTCVKYFMYWVILRMLS